MTTNRPTILPGDLVEHRTRIHLDPRIVVNVGRNWLTLDILGSESPRLPRANYRTILSNAAGLQPEQRVMS